MNKKVSSKIKEIEFSKPEGTTRGLIRSARKAYQRKGLFKSQNPKFVKNKRQERLKKINRFKVSGFPNLNVNILKPVTFIKANKVYIGMYGLKVLSIKPLSL